MFNKILTGLIGLTLSLSVAAADGMISKQSKHSVQMTADNLQQQLTSNGMKIFLRINHAENAKKVDMQLNPTELIIFGNPKAGSPLMKCAPTVAIDLTQKALIWQDDKQQVWVSYNDPAYLKQRHAIEGCDKVLQKVSGALAKMTDAAAN